MFSTSEYPQDSANDSHGRAHGRNRVALVVEEDGGCSGIRTRFLCRIQNGKINCALIEDVNCALIECVDYALIEDVFFTLIEGANCALIEGLILSFMSYI